MLVFGKLLIAITLIPILLFAFLSLQTPRPWPQMYHAAKSPIGLLIILTAICWLPGVVFSLDPMRSFEAWIRSFLLIAAATYFCFFLAARPKMIDAALRTLLITTAFCCLIGFAGAASPEFLGLIHAKGWTPLSIGAGLKQFASVAMILCPIVVLAGWYFGGRWKLLAGLDVVALIGIVFITSSRSSMAGLFAMLVVVAWILVREFGNKRTVAIFVVSVATGLFLVVAWVYLQPMAPWAKEMKSVFPVWLIDPPRQQIWLFTAEKALESPWIGHGINVVNYLPGASQPIEGMGLHTFISGHPHNWVIEIWAETGLMGLLPLVVVIIATSVHFATRFRKHFNPALLAALAVHAAYWVSGLFNFSFWSVWWQASYLVLLALCGAFVLQDEQALNKNQLKFRFPANFARILQK